jgi:growth factor-regulated tyrosine kinase substrate
VIKAVFRQLKSSDPKVVLLALTLTDACIQNNYQHIPPSINKTFMEEMVNISRGRKGYQNQEEALRLIQVWGRRFERKQEVPLFFETYMNMRTQGVTFPPEEAAPLPASSSSGDSKRYVMSCHLELCVGE